MATPFDRGNVSAVGQGTWRMEQDDRAEAIRAIQRGLDLGLTHLDTAEMYGGGAAEELLGEAIAGRRAEVFLVSKVLPSNATREGTVRACERSLRRLGTDYLDGYLLHWREDTPLEETFAGFDDLMRRGLIRSWGVSNFDERDIDDAIALVGRNVIACNQVYLSLTERHAEATVLPWCRRYGIPIVAYSPLGAGSFPSPRGPGGRVLQQIANLYEVSPRAVALAFLTRHDDVFAIPKAAKVAHVEENARALELHLGPEEIAAIDAAFPIRTQTHLPVL
ncbi:MAG: aldo/keto reductase [Myxococcaceae bacterium]|nr:aldo/keto reductase [Myxococcaceae bacterium]